MCLLREPESTGVLEVRMAPGQGLELYSCLGIFDLLLTLLGLAAFGIASCLRLAEGRVTGRKRARDTAVRAC
jgi:hypothetical protein